jgi:hypothetical protein
MNEQAEAVMAGHSSAWNAICKILTSPITRPNQDDGHTKGGHCQVRHTRYDDGYFNRQYGVARASKYNILTFRVWRFPNTQWARRSPRQ